MITSDRAAFFCSMLEYVSVFQKFLRFLFSLFYNLDMSAAERISELSEPSRVRPFYQPRYRTKYFYDNNGNLLSKQKKGLDGEVTNYTYSSENQLLGFSVYTQGGASPVQEVSYTYDALGRRIEKRVVDHRAESDVTKSFIRKYVYDGQNIAIEYDGDNRILARFSHSGLVADDVLDVDITSAGVDAKLAASIGSYQYLKDTQGTVSDITDSNGVKVQHYLYSAFGKLLGIQDANANEIGSNPAITTSFGYSGRELDSESGLMYYRARYYDPSIGRFLQEDPEAGKIREPVSLFSYLYVGNNPANFVDPTGRFTFSLGLLFGGGLGLGFAMGSGFVFAHDDEKSFAKGWEFGFYFSGAQGSYAGVGGGLSLQFGVSANDHIQDLSGGTLDLGVSGGFLARFGLGVSIPLTGNASPVYNFSAGLGPIEGSQSTFMGYTKVYGVGDASPSTSSP